MKIKKKEEQTGSNITKYKLPGIMLQTFDLFEKDRGHNFFITNHVMSDELTYGTDRSNARTKQKEDYWMLNVRSDKVEQINRWTSSVEKLKNQIEILKNDKSLTVAERQKKIARRLEIIADYEDSIVRAKEYLNRRRTMGR